MKGIILAGGFGTRLRYLPREEAILHPRGLCTRFLGYEQ